MQEFYEKAGTLAEALPYMKEFAGETFVIKFGGSAMGNEELAQKFAHDVVLMKQVGINPVIVHGGGPQIGQMLDKLKIKSEFIDGLRVTDKETVEVVEMVLSGKINKKIVQDINKAGALAVGISGKDGSLIKAKKVRRTKRDRSSNIESILDLGFVGEPIAVNPDLLAALESSDIIPVIAPIGVGENGETFNINADTCAGAIAQALVARKLIMLTDVEGVLSKNKELIGQVQLNDVNKLIDNGTISGGMIPKIETCANAVKNFVGAAHILDGRKAHSMLVEVFTPHGIGTMIS